MANLNNSNVLDFQDPGTLPNELLDMPGFVNELTDYTLSESHSPNRTLAFLGATAMLAHLAGRSYADVHGTRTNLYLIALGETGIGKDAPRRTNGRLLDLVGRTQAHTESLASGEALEELIAKHPAALFQPDEVESFVGTMRGTAAESPEANAAFRQSADTLMLLRKRLADSELFTARALVVRMNEKIAKLALIRAISSDPAHPVVSGEDVAWAVKFVTHVTKAMLHEAQFHVAEGKFDLMLKRAISFLEKQGGSADRSSLLRYLHVDAVTMKKLVSTLLMSEIIEDEMVGGGKIVYSLRSAA